MRLFTKGVAVYKLVLTGGPCGGKTSSLALIQEELVKWGWRVLSVPEVATIFITGGIHDLAYLARHDRYAYLKLQLEMLRTQQSLRERFESLAASLEEKTLIVFDRAELDTKAYVEPEEWAWLLKELGTSERELTGQYQAIIHLTSAARGAEEYYTLENNQARGESLEEARELDIRTQKAWESHPGHKLVENQGSFDQKLHEVKSLVAEFLSLDPKPEIERKFLVNFVNLEHPVLSGAKVFEIEQHYLKSDSNQAEVRLRSRKSIDETTYFRTEKSGPDPLRRIEKEAVITKRQYLEQLEQRDPNYQPIRKTRRVFEYRGQIFELDSFNSHPLTLLEIELESLEQEVRLPEFIRVEREVTQEPEFTNACLARYGYRDPNQIVFVIGDVHGHFDRLEALLKKAGLLGTCPDCQGSGDYEDSLCATCQGEGVARLRPEVKVIQLGDLGHFGSTGSPLGDLQCYQKVGSWIDELLWGNHDRAVFDKAHLFDKYQPPTPEAEALMRDLEATGKIKLCTAAHGYFLSHAGLHKAFKYQTLPEEVDRDNPRQVASFINGISPDSPERAIYDNVGTRRGGAAEAGGILWRDADEKLYTGFPQVFGHTSKPFIRRYKDSWCIDIGNAGNGQIAGLFIYPDREPELVTVPDGVEVKNLSP